MKDCRVVFPRPGSVDLESINPQPPARGQVQVRTVFSLISTGTERAFFSGAAVPEEKYPSYPGYSNIGRIVRAGQDVIGLPEGALVASGAGHRSIVNLPADQAVPLPAGLEPAKASHFMLLTVAIHAIRELRLALGEHALILGQGLLGVLVTAVARLAGAVPVIAADVDPLALAASRLLGADHEVDSSVAGWQARVREITGGRGPSVIVEASGSVAAVRGALQVAAPGARVGLLGCNREAADGIEIYRDIQCKGLTVLGIHNMNRPVDDAWTDRPTLASDILFALRLLSLDRVAVDHIPRVVTSVAQGPQAYRSLLESRGSGPMSRLLLWGD